VRVNFNGILPLRSEQEFTHIKFVGDIFKYNLVSLIMWKESNRIFENVMGVIKKLWEKSPCSIESINLSLHQGCGYCQYIEDCKNSLGMKEGIAPKDWSLKLIPFTSQSIAQQLIEEYNLTTIGDVLGHINKIKVKSIPKPLYAELPSLKLKAKALFSGRTIYPEMGQTHSYAIPRYSPIVINFDVEYDRYNDKIFAVGIFFNVFINSKLKYHAIFNNWCKIWKDAIETDKESTEICKELNEYLIREIPLKMVEKFLDCLKKLRLVQIILKGEVSKAGTSLSYKFASVSEGVTPQDEANLVISTIHRLNLILDMCNIVEEFIVIDGFQAGTYYGPDTSIFYWSRNQLENFQNMMERNIKYILDDEHARASYESILIYFTPSDTEVSHPFQHKKLFDVQGFAESFVGFPDIINYTWHKIAERKLESIINPKFWIPHFNFLDVGNWLKYLSEIDSTKKLELREQIKKQLIFKLRRIDEIRYRFQKEGNFSISKNARVISKSDYKSAILPSHYHDISHVWYLFSKLNSALQQFEDEYYRTMFPEFSIGKLYSAEVKNLNVHKAEGKKIYYTFDLIKLSSNMKLREGDSVLLIPNVKRGLKPDKQIYKWMVYIESLVWDPEIKGNHIQTKESYSNVFEQCDEEKINLAIQKWYIYPIGSDVWSIKLHNINGLLERENFGMSWLGSRLAYIWNIRSNPLLMWPKVWEFTTPSVYLYAPEFLVKYAAPFQDEALLTHISPSPDHSQELAIQNSLHHVISAILGPPGTGKSQTIAALIDEYVVRNQRKNKPVKILITSFSYAALRVVIDKIRTSRTKDNKPTPSSQVQLIFIRTATQAPIVPKIECRDVDDLLRDGKTWKLNGKLRSVTKSKLLEESLENIVIIFSNAHHLYYLNEKVQDNFTFDLICVDEASQLPTDYFMASLQYVHKYSLTLKKPTNIDTSPGTKVTDPTSILSLELDKNYDSENLTKVIIVGDHNQLPPVRVKNPPKNLELILDSLFFYYVEGHKISSKQLKVNYRSHEDIVKFTSHLGLYRDLKAYEKNANELLKGHIENVSIPWVKEVLDPQKVVCALIHKRKFEIGISLFEANIVAQIILSFYQMIAPRNKVEEIRFWTEQIGVVAPHNAQGRTIIRRIFNHFSSRTYLAKSELMNFLKNTVYSVEKFQGSDRDLIIASIGLSDKDKIGAEEDFIFDLNRFNVLTSRAKNKVIFISSNRFLKYIPEGRVNLESASKIYTYVEDFCNKETILEITNENNEKEKIRFRFKK